MSSDEGGLRTGDGEETEMDRDPKSRIRAILDRQGRPYRWVGEEIGITSQAVSQIVNGRTEGATARYALASALAREVCHLWPDAGKSNGRRGRSDGRVSHETATARGGAAT